MMYVNLWTKCFTFDKYTFAKCNQKLIVLQLYNEMYLQINSSN